MGLATRHDHTTGHTGHAGERLFHHPLVFELAAETLFAGRRREMYLRLAALSGVRPGRRVLDVGCGTGYLSRILAAVAGPEGHVTGVDPSPDMIGRARRQAPANCTYLVGEGQSLELPDESFDVVVSSLTLHHVPQEHRAAVMAEMFRVLRPGGRIGVSDVVAEDRLTPAERAERGDWAGCIAGALSRGEYEQGLRAAGFTDIQVTFTHAVADGLHSAIVRAVKP